MCEKSRGSADVVRMPGMGFVHPRESSGLEQKLQTLQSTKTNCSETVLHALQCSVAEASDDPHHPLCPVGYDQL